MKRIQPYAGPLLALCMALLVQRPASATEVPWALPAPLPDVGLGNPFSALRVTVNGSVSGINTSQSPPFVVIPVLDSANEQKTEFSTNVAHETRLGANLSAPSETGISDSTMVGVAGYGKLRAIASTTYAAGTSRSMNGSADARVVVEFLDVITFTDDGNASNKWEWNWPVSGSVSEFRLAPPLSSGGAGFARARSWLFDFGPLPAPNRFTIDALAYGDVQYATNLAAPSVFNLGSFIPDPGGAYWVYGRLDASASFYVNLGFNLGNGGTASADFSHTAELFLTPAADNPGARFSSVSGYGYAPVPLPASVALDSVGLVALFGLVRRR